MKKATAALWVALMALVTAGCGSDEPRNEQPAPYSPMAANGLTIDSEPTAELAATDETAASNLAAEIDEGTEQAAHVGRISGAQSQVQAASKGERVVTAQSTLDSHVVAMATRIVTTTYQCAQFLGAGGSGTVAYTYPETVPTAGWKSSITFKDCSYSFGARAYTVNGALVYEYLRYVSGSDFGFVGNTQDLLLSTSLNGNPVSTVRYVLTHAFDIHNGVITTSYATSNGVIKDLSVVPSGNLLVVNVYAVVDMREARGAVRVRLRDWKYDLSTARAVGGRAIITGANNTRAEVVASPTGYTVTYTDGAGRTKVFSFTYPTT